MEGDRHQLRVLRIIYGEQSWSWIVDRRAGARAAADFQLTQTQTHRDSGRGREAAASSLHCVTAHGTMAAADNWGDNTHKRALKVYTSGVWWLVQGV